MILNSPYISGSLTVTGNTNLIGALTVTGSLAGTATSSSFAYTASSAVSAYTAASAVNATTALTASYATSFTVGGTLTAQTLVVQTITSSVSFITGSTRFGSLLTNTHEFTGSMFVTGSTAFFAGNVGIGTTSPSAKLDVRTDNGVLIKGATSNNDAILSFLPTTGGRQYDFRNFGSSFAILDSSANITRMYFNFNGNTGIGLTDPSALLHISGSGSGSLFRISSHVSSSIFFVSGSGNIGIGTTTPLNVLHIYSVGSANNISIDGNNNPAMVLRSSGVIKGYSPIMVTANGSFFTDALVGDMGFRSEANRVLFGVGSGLSMMTVNSTGVNIAGNTGIGLTNPSALLHISGSGSGSLFRISSTVSSNIFFVSGSGNIGIGTTSPGGKLQVGTYGTITAPTYSTANGDGLIVDFFNIGSPYTRFGRIISSAADASEARLSFFTKDSSANPTEKVTILGNGNVGFNTTSPTGSRATNLVQVAGSLAVLRVGPWFSTDDRDFIELQADGANTKVYSPNEDFSFYNPVGNANITGSVINICSVGNTNFFNSGSERMRITSAGNVGIGTTSPSAKLHTYLADGTNDNRLLIQQGSNGYASAINLVANNNDGARYNYINSGPNNSISMWQIGGGGVENTMVMYTSGSERMRITSGGNVGIGTTSPKTKLDVDGYFGAGSKAVTITDSYSTQLTINLSNHTGVYVKVTIHGDLSSHSAIGYMGEFFIQNGADAYAEPGTIIREVNNTATATFSAKLIDPASSGTRDFTIQFKHDASATSVGGTLIYQIQGNYNSIS
jgi:hypothetical protein